MTDTYTLTHAQARALAIMLPFMTPKPYLTDNGLKAFYEARDILRPAGLGDGSTARSRPATLAFRVIWENPVHTQISVWIGRTKGARGNCGALTVRSDELAELEASGWERLS